MKAIVRGAECTFALKDFAGCEEWCDKGLKLDSSHKELVLKRKEAVEAGKVRQRDERRRAAAEKKKKQEEDKIFETIRERGIRICRRAAAEKKKKQEEDKILETIRERG